jgi:RimJ/RimL family protein N-acetyltransferase
MFTPFLIGHKTSLRAVLEEDIPVMCSWMNDQEVNAFLSHMDAPLPLAHEKDWYQRYLSQLKERSSVGFAICEKETGKLLGSTSLMSINRNDRRAKTGTVIGEKDFWGRGFGTEAKMLLLNYAFNTLNLRKIDSEVFLFNERSLRTQLRCGYKEQGRFPRHIFKNGQYVDMVSLTVFKEDWQPLWDRFTAEW